LSEIRKWIVAVACFIAILAPWTIVKALAFPPDKILLRQHYFNHLGADSDSTWTSLHFLFTHWSLEQHVTSSMPGLRKTDARRRASWRCRVRGA